MQLSREQLRWRGATETGGETIREYMGKKLLYTLKRFQSLLQYVGSTRESELVFSSDEFTLDNLRLWVATHLIRASH